MITLNDLSTQRSSQELQAETDVTYRFYTASAIPLTTTNKTRNYEKWLTEPQTIMYIVCFSVAGMAVLLNTVLFAAVLRYAHKPRPYTVLVLNLCAADCILSATTIVQYAMQYIRLRALDNGTPSGMLATIYCSQFVFQEIAWTVAFYGSMLTIVTMSAYHFVALRWTPSKISLESKQCIAVALILTWSLALGLGLLQCIIIATSYDRAMERCPLDLPKLCCQLSIYRSDRNLMNQKFHKKVLYSVFAGVIMFGLIVILCVYSYMVTKLWIMRRARIMAQKTHGSLTTAEITWRRLMATTVLLVATFCVFWLPHVVYMCLDGFDMLPHLGQAWGQEKIRILKVALHTLGCLCGMFDPFIYCLRVPEVRNSLQKTPGIRHVLFVFTTSITNGEVARNSKCTTNA